jgi:hypothetical protein
VIFICHALLPEHSFECLYSYLSFILIFKNIIVTLLTHSCSSKGKGKAIPVTGCGGPYGCETLRLPHFLDNQLTDGGEVVSLMHRPATLYPQEDSWHSFLLEAESTPGP